MEDSSIAKSVRGCLGLFQELSKLLSPPSNPSNQTALTTIMEEEPRFKVWCGNIGAHGSGRRSLQFRLRDASHLQKQVLALLADLSKLLEDASAIVQGNKVPWDQIGEIEISDDGSDSLEDDSDNELPRTEIEQIASSVLDTVNCLLRLSVAIRNPAPHDRFTISVPIDVSHFESFDTQHVQAKFPKVDSFLAQRLGNAISRRRQYFKYRERHHLKLAHGLDPKDKADGESTIASSIPGHTKSTGFHSTLHAVNEDDVSDAGISQTSFASSLTDTDTLRIPPLPKSAESGPFECPFCFMMIMASNRVSWKRHVFADLRPYICLSKDCAAADKWFDTRHEWILHEIENHWKFYVCPFSCDETFQSRFDCVEHIDKSHPSTTPEHQFEATINMSYRQIRAEDGMRCPMCYESLYSVKNYQIHVGRHQEQLAIFALPITHSQGDDDDLDDEGEGLDADGHDFDNDVNDENDIGCDESYKFALDASARVSLGSSATEEELRNDTTENTNRIARYDTDDTTEIIQSKKSSSTNDTYMIIQESNFKLSSNPEFGIPSEETGSPMMGMTSAGSGIPFNRPAALLSDSSNTIFYDADDEHQHVDDEDHNNLSDSQQFYLQQQHQRFQQLRINYRLIMNAIHQKHMLHQQKRRQLMVQHDHHREEILDPELRLFNGQFQQVDPGYSSSNYPFSDESDRLYTNIIESMDTYKKGLEAHLEKTTVTDTEMLKELEQQIEDVIPEEVQLEVLKEITAKIHKDSEDALAAQLKKMKLQSEDMKRALELLELDVRRIVEAVKTKKAMRTREAERAAYESLEAEKRAGEMNEQVAAEVESQGAKTSEPEFKADLKAVKDQGTRIEGRRTGSSRSSSSNSL